MCGIAGIVSPVGAFVGDAAIGSGAAAARGGALGRMTAALTKRGPDDEGFYADDTAGLGHRRLAIIDVAHGAQPMFAADGRFAAVVNGEIYNYRSLRDELRAEGCTFVTESDSEVVVHGHAVWGESLPQRLDGQFAYAVWDRVEKCVVLGRDRFGEKPLYYGLTPDGEWLFGSELTALLAHGGLPARCNAEALVNYLVAESVPAPRAMINGTWKVAPGTEVILRASGSSGTTPSANVPTIRRYWDLQFPKTLRQDTPTSIRELRCALREAVISRMVADVPLGVFSSGGIDSALVVAFASEYRDRDLDTFSVGFDDPTYDETRYARKVAAAFGVRHQVRRVRGRDLQELIPSLGELLDEPLADGSIVPTHLLCRFAREHVTVALGGDGGDELFGGYPTMQLDALAAPLLDSVPSWVGGVANSLLRHLPVGGGYLSLDFKLKQLVRGMGFAGAERHQAWLAAFLPAELSDLLSPDFCRGLDLEEPMTALGELLAAATGRTDDQRTMYFYLKRFLGDQILTKVDRASMAVGLEVRAPFLAPQVVAIASQLPAQLRAARGLTKRALKAAARGILPDEIIDRKKHGFGMPIDRWLRAELNPWLRDLLSEDRLARDGVFAPSAVARLIDEHSRGLANHRKPLWTLAVLHSWADAHSVSLR